MIGKLHPRIGWTIAAHLMLGFSMGLVARALPGWDWPIWVSIWYMALLCSQVLLLGTWLGLSATSWWRKIVGLAAGIGWLAALSLAPGPPPNTSAALTLVAIHASAVFVIAVCFAFLRWRWVKLEHRSGAETLPAASDLQFSLRSLIGLTVTVALLLALGRIIQGLGEETPSLLIVAFVFALVALLASLLLVWSCLGPGRIVVRGPTMLGGMMALGLVIPYYLGGPTWRFVIWPALLALIAAFTGGTLVVVRSCGYRLVRREASAIPLVASIGTADGGRSDA
jgi:hypothetical protein